MGVTLNLNEDKFWNKIDVRGKDECWEWKSLKGTGKRPQILVEGVVTRSYRVSYCLYNGLDLCDINIICHECDNPTCCNPHHLTNSDQSYNVKGMMERGRGRGQFISGYRKADGKYIKAEYKPKSEYKRPVSNFNCNFCGNNFNSRSDKDAKFCSKACFNLHRKKIGLEVGNLVVKGRAHKVYNCKVCQSETIKRSDSSLAKIKVCSVKCKRELSCQ